MVDEARFSGLTCTDLGTPGICRRRAGRGWCFVDPAGRVIRDADERMRLLAVALQPVYRQAWFPLSVRPLRQPPEGWFLLPVQP